jgi:hypothetical protein
MRKVMVGLVIIGAVMVLRPLVRRRVVHGMREHCKQMAAKCKQMMAQSGARGEEAGMPEHGEQVAEHVGDRREAASA